MSVNNKECDRELCEICDLDPDALLKSEGNGFEVAFYRYVPPRESTTVGKKPDNPKEGDEYYDEDKKLWYVFRSGKWELVEW